MLVNQIISFVAITLIFGFILSRLGRKFFSIPVWHYFIPYYNMVPLLKCANMNPLFAVVLAVDGLLGILINIKIANYGMVIFQYPTLEVYAYYLFTFIGIILYFVITGKIAKRLGKSFWLNTIFAWTSIPLLIFAFGKAMPENSGDIKV